MRKRCMIGVNSWILYRTCNSFLNYSASGASFSTITFCFMRKLASDKLNDHRYFGATITVYSPFSGSRSSVSSNSVPR